MKKSIPSFIQAHKGASFAIKFFLFAGCFFGIQQLCHRATHGFRVYKIHSYLPYDTRWEIAPLAEVQRKEVDAALAQEFRYLGNGLQCYAFASADDRYVLKVFKHHHMRPKSWLNQIRLPGLLDIKRQQIIRSRERRCENSFKSYKIAYNCLKEETGIIYIHLNKTSEFSHLLKLIDNIGIKHTVDLNQVEFILQKKAEPFFPILEKHILTKNDTEAKKCLDSLILLIIGRSKKGIADKDPVVWRNFGFAGNRAVEIDVGSFVEDPYAAKPYWLKNELFYETLEVRKWLQTHAPHLHSYFEQQITTILNNETFL